ncbi:hypothetical protein HDU93_002446 [Gonapodya sp. JEL0774]|nr:hypothetical protein HDU93_002446 [Gonapodya sp. JEL0774]
MAPQAANAPPPSAISAKTATAYQELWAHGKGTGDVFKQSSDDVKEERKARAPEMTNYYYDLATDLYEYAQLDGVKQLRSNLSGWGTSFHFARMFPGDGFAQNLARHEDFLALKLQLKPGMRVLDVGCGVGGPLREIAKFSGATVIGLNNNDYQIQRAKMYNKKYGLEQITDVVKGNFLAIPFPDNSFDAVYAIEATCHAPHPKDVYSEIFRVLKPGGKFACYEWCTTDKYDENDPVQRKAMLDIEEGDSIAHLYRTSESLAAVKQVGFNVLEECDLAAKDVNDGWGKQSPWYGPLAGIMVDWTFDEMVRYFRTSKVGGVITDNFVTVMEFIGLAPKGTKAASRTLMTASDGLVYSGEKGTFTVRYGSFFTHVGPNSNFNTLLMDKPMYFFLGQKP